MGVLLLRQLDEPIALFDTRPCKVDPLPCKFVCRHQDGVVRKWKALWLREVFEVRDPGARWRGLHRFRHRLLPVHDLQRGVAGGPLDHLRDRVGPPSSTYVINESA